MQQFVHAQQVLARGTPITSIASVASGTIVVHPCRFGSSSLGVCSRAYGAEQRDENDAASHDGKHDPKERVTFDAASSETCQRDIAPPVEFA